MPVSEYVRDQSCKGVFLTCKENSVSNTINVKTEVLVNPCTEAKKVPKSASTTDDIK
jgi:hypothetical protein